MGNLARAAVIIAKINGLVLILGLVLGLVTVLLAVLSVKVDKEVVILHLWPTGTLDNSTPIPPQVTGRSTPPLQGLTVEEAEEWGIPLERKRRRRPIV